MRTRVRFRQFKVSHKSYFTIRKITCYWWWWLDAIAIKIKMEKSQAKWAIASSKDSIEIVRSPFDWWEIYENSSSSSTFLKCVEKCLLVLNFYTNTSTLCFALNLILALILCFFVTKKKPLRKLCLNLYSICMHM